MSLLAVALDVSEYWLMGLDVEMEREDTETVIREQRKRFEAYTRGIYENKEAEILLKLYEQLTEENRAKARRYMERLLAVQKMEEESL